MTHTDDDVEVATEGIRTEAKKWFGFADDMEPVARLAAAQKLETSSFIIFDVIDITSTVRATDLEKVYDKMQQWLSDLFGQAVDQFDAFGKALNKYADEYEATEGHVKKSFDEIAAS